MGISKKIFFLIFILLISPKAYPQTERDIPSTGHNDKAPTKEPSAKFYSSQFQVIACVTDELQITIKGDKIELITGFLDDQDSYIPGKSDACDFYTHGIDILISGPKGRNKKSRALSYYNKGWKKEKKDGKSLWKRGAKLDDLGIELPMIKRSITAIWNLKLDTLEEGGGEVEIIGQNTIRLKNKVVDPDGPVLYKFSFGYLYQIPYETHIPDNDRRFRRLRAAEISLNLETPYPLTIRTEGNRITFEMQDFEAFQISQGRSFNSDDLWFNKDASIEISNYDGDGYKLIIPPPPDEWLPKTVPLNLDVDDSLPTRVIEVRPHLGERGKRYKHVTITGQNEIRIPGSLEINDDLESLRYSIGFYYVYFENE